MILPRLFYVSAMLFVLGCEEENRELKSPFYKEPTTEPSVGTAPVAAPSRGGRATVDSRGRRILPATRATVQDTPIEQEKTAPDGTPIARDLSAELRTAFGDPSSCVPAGTAAQEVTNIGLSASLTADGMIYRASVSAPFDSTIRDCLMRKLSGLSMRGPIPGAPTTVTATVQLRRSPTTRDEPAAPTVVRPQGYVAPTSSLPAVGQGRPNGFVNPTSTLPATGEGRPSGFVAPSNTLPATGGTGRIAGQ